MAKKQESPKAKSKLVWRNDLFIIGYGKVFGGQEATGEALKALKELGLEASKYAE